MAESSSKKLFPRGVAETLLVALFFHSYGAPIFDPLRPGFLDRPLAEYRHAISTISKGHQIGMDKPLVDALGSVKEAVYVAFEPVRRSAEDNARMR